MAWLMIPHLRVQTANIHSAGCLVGGAPIVTASLFGHALARELNSRDTGMIIVHHDRQELGDYAYGRFYPQQRRGAVFIDKDDYSSKNKQALSLQPTATAHLHLSLLIEFDVLDQLEQVRTWLSRARFAGGQVISFGELGLFTDDDFGKAVHELPRGFLLIDRHAWLQVYQASHQVNRLQAFVQLLANQDATRPWLSAAVVGYAALEPVTQRDGVRENWPHAYAEPMLGLVQYVPISHFLDGASEQQQQMYQDIDIVWQRTWRRSRADLAQPGIFLLSQQTTEEA